MIFYIGSGKWKLRFRLLHGCTFNCIHKKEKTYTVNSTDVHTTLISVDLIYTGEKKYVPKRL